MTYAISPRPSAISAHLICLGSMLIWAVGLPAVDLVIGKLPPLQITAIRNLLAAAFLLPLWLLVEGVAPLRRAAWGKGIVIGAICVGLGAVLLVFAQARTDAITVSIVTATMPVVGIGLELLLDGRKLRLQTVAGLSLSLFGGWLAYGEGRGDLHIGVGALAAFGAVVAYTWGSRATVMAFSDMTSLGRTALTVTGAAIAMNGLVLLSAGHFGPPVQWALVGPREWAALAIYGIGSLGISQILWIIAVGRLGIGIASLHMNAVPFYVMLIFFVMGHGWNWVQAGAAGIVIIGVMIAQGRSERA